MTAQQFVDFMTKASNHAVSSLDSEIEISDTKYKDQVWSADVSYVDHASKTVVLAACLDYGNDDNLIDTLRSLKDWFRSNGVKRDYEMVFENHDSEQFDDIEVVRPDHLAILYSEAKIEELYG